MLRPCARFCVTAGFEAAYEQPTTNTGIPLNELRPRARIRRAPSRIGHIPTYGPAAASGELLSGTTRSNSYSKKPKYYQGQARPETAPGPGSRAPVISTDPG